MQSRKADGTKIRRAREQADLTVDEMVAALKEREGIERHPDTIRNIELGHNRAGLKVLNAIARVLDVPREELLADEPSDAGVRT